MNYGKFSRGVACALARLGGERGQALGEYSLVLALVAMAAVVALGAVGLAVSGFYNSFLDMLPG